MWWFEEFVPEATDESGDEGGMGLLGLLPCNVKPSKGKPLPLLAVSSGDDPEKKRCKDVAVHIALLPDYR